MTAMIHSLHAGGHRRRPLAAALAACLLTSSLAHAAGAQTDAGTERTLLRAAPEQRIFADFPTSRARRPNTPAATWTVSNCNDDGPGSLRAAVKDAADGDLIDLTALTCGTITLQTGAIAVRQDNLNLQGPGRDALSIDGNAADRVFFDSGRGELVLRDLTVRNGRNYGKDSDIVGGGCIAARGYVVLDGTTVKGCYAAGRGAYGGAIYAYGLTMTNSTLSGNTVRAVHTLGDTGSFGGAAFVYTIALTDSTVSGNRTSHADNPGHSHYDIGGGISSVRGGSIINTTIDSNYSQGRGGGVASFSPLAISNSTISGNVAAEEIGGGLFVRRPAAVEISNSTLTANHAEAGGGGLYLAATDSTMQSSIIYGNSVGDGDGKFAEVQVRASTALTIGGDHNLIGAAGPSATVPNDTLQADPLLGPLSANGGPARTHALPRGSPAVDTGSNPQGLTYDQRGAPFPRVYGAASDIGAFEQQALAPPAQQTPVPTLSTWATVLLGSLLALVAFITQRRRPQKRRIDGRRRH
jgi:hypothetical protein